MVTSTLRRAIEIFRQEGPIALCRRTADFINRHTFQNVLPFRRTDYGPTEYPLIVRTIVWYTIGTVLGDRLSLYLSVRRLRRATRRESDLADVVSTAFEYVGVGQYHTIRPMQSRTELATLARRVADIEPEAVLELGSARGGTFYVWCQGLDSVETAISVDLPPDETPGPATDRSFFHHFADIEIVCIRADAHAEETFARISEAIKTVDFLFIDADKSYEGVRRHFKMYRPLVSDGGVIAFHDICYDDGVRRFWQELEADYNTERIVQTTTRISGPYTFGIGVVYV